MKSAVRCVCNRPGSTMSPDAALLTCLQIALIRDGLLAWCVAHPDAPEAVARAWDRCDEHESMRGVLYESGLEKWLPRWNSMFCTVRNADGSTACLGSQCQRCLAAIRSAYPTLDLARVIDACKERT